MTTLLPVPVGHHGTVDNAHLDENDDDDHHIIRQAQQTQESLGDDVDGAHHIQDGHHDGQDHPQLERHEDTPPREELCPDVAEDGGQVL